MPAFYHKPRTISDLVDHVVGRILDRLGVENDLFHKWGGVEPDDVEE
jgi:4-hydroxy-3-polyprenylbenzoate decarboxylase